MPDFASMLARHRKLAGEVTEQRGYLEFLESELADLEKEMSEFVARLQQPEQTPQGTVIFDGRQFPGLTLKSLPGLQLQPKTERSTAGASRSLRETAKAIEELGDGVDAVRLSQHLGITREAARLRLQRAALAGLIARMASGRYRAVKRKPMESKAEIEADDIEKESDGSGRRPTNSTTA